MVDDADHLPNGVGVVHLVVCVPGILWQLGGLAGGRGGGLPIRGRLDVDVDELEDGAQHAGREPAPRGGPAARRGSGTDVHG